MKEAYAVIGANFGDEGKGLVTDFLAAQEGPETLVVRFNGGAQAGHTVETPDGKRHVFGHFGSGTLTGCATFLSRFFVFNPLTFLKEWEQLRLLGASPHVMADPSALVTTPFDMIVNQYAEESRGGARHGSCGLGFSETIERSQNPAFALRLEDLSDADFLRCRLILIRDEWIPARLAALGLFPARAPWAEYLASPFLIERFIEDVRLFLSRLEKADASVLRRAAPIVFEGAQGLLLDPTYGWFPHVTRSATGLANVLALAEEAGIDEIHAHYITRAYTTRHGAGPLPHETAQLPYFGIEDLTNIPNPHQGVLRFAWPDVDLLRRTIMQDYGQPRRWVKVALALAVTCLDQIGALAHFVKDGQRTFLDAEAFPFFLADFLGAGRLLVSYGPTREDVEASPYTGFGAEKTACEEGARTKKAFA